MEFRILPAALRVLDDDGLPVSLRRQDGSLLGSAEANVLRALVACGDVGISAPDLERIAPSAKRAITVLRHALAGIRRSDEARLGADQSLIRTQRGRPTFYAIVLRPDDRVDLDDLLETVDQMSSTDAVVSLGSRVAELRDLVATLRTSPMAGLFAEFEETTLVSDRLEAMRITLWRLAALAELEAGSPRRCLDLCDELLAEEHRDDRVAEVAVKATLQQTGSLSAVRLAIDRYFGTIELTPAVAAMLEEPTGAGLGNGDRSRASAAPDQTEMAGSVFLASSLENDDRNRLVAEHLRANGIETVLPREEIEAALAGARVPTGSALRAACCAALESCDTVVVDLEVYGLDSAWLLGYADAVGKRVVGWNADGRAGSLTRRVNRRRYEECPMHGWDALPKFDTLEEVERALEGRRTFVAVPLRHTWLFDALRSSRMHGDLVIVPDHLDPEQLPDGVPIASRGITRQLQDSCEAVLVELPRYGMDVAWHLGYSGGTGQQVVGLMGHDDRVERVRATAWSHWMHGWETRSVVTSLDELASVVALGAGHD